MQEMEETHVPSLHQEDPWSKKQQSIPVFLPGESHGQTSLAGYNPWGHKESDTTEQLHFHFHSLLSKFDNWEAESGILIIACPVAQSCLTPCNALDKGLPWSSVRGISQARILEWIAISYSRGSS